MRRDFDEEHSEESQHRVQRKNHDTTQHNDLRDESNRPRTARDHVRIQMMSEMQ